MLWWTLFGGGALLLVGAIVLGFSWWADRSLTRHEKTITETEWDG